VSPLALGLDLGSSGLRLALAEASGADSAGLLIETSSAYPGNFNEPKAWRQGLIALAQRLPAERRRNVRAIALDGTSGTLLLCRPDGSLLPGALGLALPYHQACPEQRELTRQLCGDDTSPAASASSSLARALQLLHRARQGGEGQELLLRHQADWLLGWLLGDWRWGEEGNNLRLGWDLERQVWSGAIATQPWSASLPQICPSGAILGQLSAEAAAQLDLPSSCLVVSGSTDANAAVLAADPQEGDGVCVLGTTLVLKQFCPAPIKAPGVSSHRLDGRWLVGGASNAGAGILRRFYSDAQITELSRQIDPERPTGLDLLPLPAPGERFPSDDPDLEPRLQPRPVSDALYLQALLEGLTAIEARGWRRLQQLGAPPLRRVITLGGGAHNPQWRQLRQRVLDVPVHNRPSLSAALGMAQLALRAQARMGGSAAGLA
jgi:sugar (pentulose or hexulose) kinase